MVARVDQPGRAEIELELWRRDWRGCLLVSVAPNVQAIYFGKGHRSGRVPEGFCMLLRKYLEGSRIISVNQNGFEREMQIVFTMPPHVAHITRKASLVVSFLGSRGNINLIDEGGSTIGSLSRAVLAPPEKLPPTSVGVSDITSWSRESRPDTPVRKLLVKNIEGIGNLIAGEIVVRAGMDPEMKAADVDDTVAAKLCSALAEILEYSLPGKCRPVVFSFKGSPVDFHCLDLAEYAGMERISFNSCLEAAAFFWTRKREQFAFEELRRKLETAITRSIKRAERKANLQAEEADRGREAERYRIMGELLITYCHLIPPHSKSARLPNHYDPNGGEIDIPLDPSLSPIDNAQAYFKKYRKAISSQKLAGEQLAKTREELAYLSQVEQAVLMASDSEELGLLEEELISQGYIPSRKEKSATKTKQAGPRVFWTSEGLQVLVGRSNVQNDMITFRMARDDDIWLHAKGSPGAHVILRKSEHPGDWPPKASLEEAASIAAFYSKARGSAKAPVDWTMVCHVRKPSGARPGMVIYDHQRTIMVTPKCPESTEKEKQ